MHVVGCLDSKIFLQRNGIEPGLLPRNDKRSVQARQVFQAGSWTHVLILIQQGHTDVVLDRHNGMNYNIVIGALEFTGAPDRPPRNSGSR